LIGAELMRRIAAMRSSKIAAVRGLGLLIGIEFRDPESARRFVAATIARGVIINWTLNAEKVVRLAPPLTIATDEIDFAVDAMQAALDATKD
jgi:acetylornithine/succinyldiaminopimelate/putrescine aminotransferase